MNYRITPGLPNLCYVTPADQSAMLPYDGTTVVYLGPDTPLEYRGPVVLPPVVQQSLTEHFARVAGMENDTERYLYLSTCKAWKVSTT